ncbi:MAG: hypothetical protein AB1405_02010 [Bdellovibrionota bacterium]
MGDRLGELSPCMQGYVTLVRNDLARMGIDTEILYTGRDRGEFGLTMVNGATKAKSFGDSFHSQKPLTAPPAEEGLYKALAFDLGIPQTRSAVTGAVRRYNWEDPRYKVFGQVAGKYGLTWGGRFKSICDMGHIQGPRIARPGPEHWAMTPEQLDAWCRKEIEENRRLLALAS